VSGYDPQALRFYTLRASLTKGRRVSRRECKQGWPSRTGTGLQYSETESQPLFLAATSFFRNTADRLHSHCAMHVPLLLVRLKDTEKFRINCTSQDGKKNQIINALLLFPALYMDR